MTLMVVGEFVEHGQTPRARQLTTNSFATFTTRILLIRANVFRQYRLAVLTPAEGGRNGKRERRRVGTSTIPEDARAWRSSFSNDSAEEE